MSRYHLVLAPLRSLPGYALHRWLHPSSLRAGRAWVATLLISSCLAGIGAGAAPAAQPAGSAVAPADDGRIIVPAIDTRGYRAVTLRNGIRAVLISDPSTEKAAAALAVQRGSFDEPADIPGLAHFLEHMLFLGTDKYPGADEYEKYISANGGSHNAYTASEHTNFFFDISADHLQPALDRFGQFFIAPRFDATYVQREMNAVSSEYQMQLKDDAWRGQSVEKTVLNPAHPGTRFSIGNLTTLADRPGRPTRAALISFFNAAYAPQDMTLAVYGRESLDDLEQMVKQIFDAVPKRSGLRRPVRPALTLAGSLPLRLEYKPEKQQHSLGFEFPLPGLDANYRENPLEYLSNLIGHEGEGSLHALLKARGWIDSLSAGSERIDAQNTMLAVQMELTPEGVEHEAEIGDALFAYLDQLRRTGVQARLYDEQSMLARMAFDYQEAGKPIGKVIGLVANRALYPLRDVLRGPFAVDRFDAALINAQLARLTPDNVLVTVANPDATPSKRERWFDVPYDSAPLAPALRARWQHPPMLAELALPAANPFVPSSLALIDVSSPTGKPTQLPAPAGLTLWHLADTEFRAPRAAIVLRLQSDLPAADARGAAATAILAALLSDELNAYAYPAYLAGLSYDVRPDARGLLVSIGGYSDKQSVLLQRVLTSLKTLHIDPAKFERYRGELVRDWTNARKARPFEQARAELGVVLVTGHFEPEELIAAAAKLDPATLAAFQQQLLQGSAADMLVHGNLDAAAAARLGAIVGNTLTLCATCTAHLPEVRIIKQRSALVRQVEHDDAAMLLYVQGESRADAERARYGLLAAMIHPPYFDALRTQQTLGYVVGASPAPVDRVPGLTFVVQSPVAGVPKIMNATETFLGTFRAQLAAMTPAEFEAQRAGFLSRLLDPDHDLGARSARLWNDLNDGVTTFDTRERIAEATRRIDQPSFLAFYDAFVKRASGQRLVIALPGKFGDVGRLGAPPAQLHDGFVPR